MATIPPAAVAHYRTVRRMEAAARTAARTAWARVNPQAIRESWAVAAPALIRRVATIQAEAGIAGSTYTAMVLAAQGTYDPPTALTDPTGMVGWLMDDDVPGAAVALTDVIDAPAVSTLTRIGRGVSVEESMAAGGRQAARLAATAVADAARQSASVDIATRQRTGYIRMLNPPSCSRCAVLAGRFYRWNDGFPRHPGCDCCHVGTTVRSQAAAQREGLIDDPYDYFRSLSTEDQDRIFTRAGAQAIRDGADISQVVNARRGMAGATRVQGGRRLRLAATDPRRRWTSEGTTSRSVWRRSGGQGRLRLTPEGIYARAGSREEAIRLLAQHGYILPAGQVLAPIRGVDYVGLGQMGRGGTRRAASRAVLDAVASGVRDPSVRATMTAAERRVDDALRDWRLAASGIDPTSPGAVELRGGARIGGTIRPATPEQVAYYEVMYRSLLARGGQR